MASQRAWRAKALTIVSAVVAVILCVFTLRAFSMGDSLGGICTAVGLPCVGATFWVAWTQRGKLPHWAPYPMLVYLIAMLLIFTFIVPVGQGAALMWYAAGPSLIVLTLGARAGAFFSVILLAMLIAGILTVDHVLPLEYGLRLCLAFLLSFALVYAYERERNRALAALGAARERIAALEGMLSICGWCHKWMRDETGEWVSTEQFFEDRAPVQFSHGLCPGCADKLESAHPKAETV